jgi:acyl carrier protein
VASPALAFASRTSSGCAALATTDLESNDMKDALVQLIVKVASELDDLDAAVRDGLSEGTKLFGSEGILDSMGLVSLVVAVEQAIDDEYGVAVALADERALSQRHSPYRTIGALAEYAGAELEKNRG